MVWFFASVTIALLLAALRDEFREGGSLHLGLVELVGPNHPDFAHPDDMLEFPIHDGWEPEDVARTYAEIQAL